MSASIARMICGFIRATTVGHERAIFRTLPKEQINVIKVPEIVGQLFVGATVRYFNAAYRSLILKNDPYIQVSFGQMQQVCGHSYICLLNIVFANCVSVHQSIDRSKLDLSSLENYQKSFEALLNPILVNLEQKLAESLNHKCSGTDISKCDPKKDMFHMEVTRQK